jgi:RNA polymerase sigma-70 factor (ECF subfamily)
MSADYEYKQLSDEKLFSLVKNGTNAAFDELYDRYSRRLLHYLLRMLQGDESRAQDMLQEIFLKILNKRNQFDDQQKFSAWVFAIAHNLCKNEYRFLSSHNEVSLEAANTMADTTAESYLISEQIDLQIFRKQLLQFIYSIPAAQRSVFLLRFQENLSIPEIARIMNYPSGTVKSQLHYILRKIAEHLKVFDPYKSEVP